LEYYFSCKGDNDGGEGSGGTRANVGVSDGFSSGD
jgi:hypothetical protein